MNEPSRVDQEIVDRIVRALAGLQYGSVQIIVQDARVIQIDKTEKVRFTRQEPSDDEG